MEYWSVGVLRQVGIVTVGRKTRRAEDVTNGLILSAPVLSRAVRVAPPNDVRNPRCPYDRKYSFLTAMRHARNNSKPARILLPSNHVLGAPSFSPHRVLVVTKTVRSFS
jgi:hypothetical protein